MTWGWEFVWIIERKFPEATAAEVRTMVLRVVRELLEAREMLPGEAAEEGLPIVPWHDAPVDEVIRMIEERWDALGRPPNIGEVMYFTV